MAPLRRSPRGRSGFTLIELTVVVVVIGILAAIAVPRLIGWSRRTREAEAAPLLKQVQTLEERYRARTNAFTTDITELEGGAAIAAGGKHYTLDVLPHATGYCAVANPSEEGLQAGVTARSMDALGNLYESATCQ